MVGARVTAPEFTVQKKIGWQCVYDVLWQSELPALSREHSFLGWIPESSDSIILLEHPPVLSSKRTQACGGVPVGRVRTGLRHETGSNGLADIRNSVGCLGKEFLRRILRDPLAVCQSDVRE